MGPSKNTDSEHIEETPVEGGNIATPKQAQVATDVGRSLTVRQALMIYPGPSCGRQECRQPSSCWAMIPLF